MIQKMLGVIGGMGPAASALFYEMVIARTRASCDQEHVPMLLWSHCTLPDRTRLLLSGRQDELFSLLLKDVHLLINGGADVLAIPCNTSHVLAEALQDAIDIPLVNMVHSAAETAAKRGCRRVGVLATEGTVHHGLYQTACTRRGITPIVPPAPVQQQVTALIYDRIKAGHPARAEDMADIEGWLHAESCDGAILACTELSVARMQLALSDFYIDAMLALAEASILACGGGLKE